MSLYAKYSLGIFISFVLLALAMLYMFPLIHYFAGNSTFTAGKFELTRYILWAILLIVVGYNKLVEKQPFFLWKDKKYSILFYITSIISLYFICFFGGAFVNAITMIITNENVSDKTLKIAQLFKNNYYLIFLTCLTAGVTEEVMMRGYIQPRITQIYKNYWVGILGSAFLFAILHSTYGTFGQVVVPFFIGVIFAMFYKKYSNLKILIICHFMYDFISLMLMNFLDLKKLTTFLVL